MSSRDKIVKALRDSGLILPTVDSGASGDQFAGLCIIGCRLGCFLSWCADAQCRINGCMLGCVEGCANACVTLQCIIERCYTSGTIGSAKGTGGVNS